MTPGLIAFLKKCLAPNSLEWMFLQDRPENASGVKIETIYKGPLRRHRKSLTKVLIDSGIRKFHGAQDRRWKKWILNREIVSFFVSGKMPKLRELSVAFDHRYWVSLARNTTHERLLTSDSISSSNSYLKSRTSGHSTSITSTLRTGTTTWTPKSSHFRSSTS